MAKTPVLINGVNYSWANVSFVMFGIVVKGITEINYGKKQKKENNYGWGQEPTSRGYGNNEYEASVTLYLDEWQAVIAASPNKDPLQIPFGDFPVVFGGDRVTAKTDILRAAEFLNDDLKTSQGEGRILVTVPMIIAGVDHQ